MVDIVVVAIVVLIWIKRVIYVSGTSRALFNDNADFFFNRPDEM